MKKKYHAIYSIQNADNFSLKLIESGFKTKKEATSYMSSYAAHCVIIEYYE
jgi:hypothetical protein